MQPVRDLLVLGNRAIGQATIASVRLPIDRSIMTVDLERLLAKRTFEQPEREAVRKLITPGEVVLELGACLGFISTFVRKHTRAGAIIAVEANPLLIPYIQRVHALNGVTDVTVINAVVLPNPATPSVKFYCRAQVPTSSLSPEGAPPTSIVEVKTVDLADIINRYAPKVLVIDIEGGELELFQAATLGTIEKLIIELHPQAYGLSGMQDIFGNIHRLGFAYDATASAGQVVSFRRP